MIAADRLESLVLAPFAEARTLLGARLFRLTVLVPHPGAIGVGALRTLRIRPSLSGAAGEAVGYDVIAGYERYDETRRRRSAAKS